MKKTRLLPLLMILPLLAGCNKEAITIFPVDQFVEMDTKFSADGSYTIGILQPVAHSALEAAQNGFIEKLSELGWVAGTNVTYKIQNAAGDGNSLIRYADSLIADCDMVVGIATGSAQQLKSSQFNAGTHKPILFTAVTDPVDAKVVNSNAVPGGYITGTSDAQPVAEQIKLMKECMPTLSKVGILYTASEQNSYVQAMDAAIAVKDIGLTPITMTCNDQSDIGAVTSKLIAEGVQGMYIPTDNNLAAHVNEVGELCDASGVLLCVGEEGMVKNGGHVSLSIDYTMLGARLGVMANEILCGAKSPNMIPVQTMSLSELVYVKSSANLGKAGITLSSEAEAKDWKDVA